MALSVYTQPRPGAEQVLQLRSSRGKSTAGTARRKCCHLLGPLIRLYKYVPQGILHLWRDVQRQQASTDMALTPLKCTCSPLETAPEVLILWAFVISYAFWLLLAAAECLRALELEPLEAGFTAFSQ